MTWPSLSGWLGRGVLVAAAVATYANSLDNGFHYDDSHSIVDNYHLRSLANIASFFVDPGQFSREPGMAMYRPLLLVTYAVNYALGGHDPFGYHLVNLLLHVLAAAAVTALVTVFARNHTTGWWVGMLFALHPIQSQAVHYISARSELLSALGALVAFLMAIGNRAPAATAAAAAGGLLAKSTAVVLLPLLIAHRWLRFEPLAKRQLLLVAAAIVCYLVISFATGFLGGALQQDVRPYGVHLLTQVKALVYYASLIVMPVRLAVEHNFTTSEIPTEWPVLGSAAFLGSMVAVAWACRGSSRWGLWVLAWVGASLSVTFLKPLNVLVSEHRLYLAAAGLFAGALLAVGTGVRARRLVPAGLVALVLLALLTWQRGAVWQDELTLWRDAAARGGEEMFRVHSNLGLAQLEAGDLAGAAVSLQRALALNPGHAKSWNSLGLVHAAVGDLLQARKAFERARMLAPGLAGVHNNLARLHARVGDHQAAAERARAALAIDSRYGPAHVNLGLALQRLGEPQAAVGHYRQALLQEPEFAAAHNNLGLLHAEAGRLEEAVHHLQAAVDQQPEDVGMQLNLQLVQLQLRGVTPRQAYRQLLAARPDDPVLWRAQADLCLREADFRCALGSYERVVESATAGPGAYAGLAAARRALGDLEGAIAAYEEAVELAPGRTDLRNNLASAYAAAGRIEAAIAVTRAVLERDGGDRRARQNLTRLLQHSGASIR